MFSATSRLALKGFSCNFMSCTFLTCPVNDVSLDIVSHKLRPLYVIFMKLKVLYFVHKR